MFTTKISLATAAPNIAPFGVLLLPCLVVIAFLGFGLWPWKGFEVWERFVQDGRGHRAQCHPALRPSSALDLWQEIFMKYA